MAIELTDELLELQRAADAARDQATGAGYSPRAWRPWQDAAAAVQAAVTAHAAATGLNRYEVEQALKAAVRQPAEG
ncbi:hypothetical protein [Streptomyces sp. NPDC002889]|uniref:hypothetical protein n=1 Tax=Streptomyces sp. NPDC002889 TaxID=3364669 RepID=UPI0036C53F35